MSKGNPLLVKTPWYVMLPVVALACVWAERVLNQQLEDDERHHYVNATFFKTEGDRDYLSADKKKDEWFDITNMTHLEKKGFQYGIGKDKIAAIDDPVFVDADDPRVLEALKQTRDSLPDMRVIGYAVGSDIRAYPVGLLNDHELVNDVIGGKPVTVGW